jgi:hypothetical protein
VHFEHPVKGVLLRIVSNFFYLEAKINESIFEQRIVVERHQDDRLIAAVGALD